MCESHFLQAQLDPWILQPFGILEVSRKFNAIDKCWSRPKTILKWRHRNVYSKLACLKCADGLWFSDAPDTRAYLKYVHILYFWIFESGFKIVLIFFFFLKQEVHPPSPTPPLNLLWLEMETAKWAKIAFIYLYFNKTAQISHEITSILLLRSGWEAVCF